tara:strand:+ start:2129 stop:2281 length:153 start_codon:yes stop_codon:yes gene_type:complete
VIEGFGYAEFTHSLINRSLLFELYYRGMSFSRRDFLGKAAGFLALAFANP